MSNFRYDLFDYVRRVGPMYGVEDFALFLYSLVKMHKPQNIFELGSGSGACSLLAARALSENGEGKVHSFDNGSHWKNLCCRTELSPFEPASASSYHSFLSGLAKRFSVDDFVEFHEASFPPFPQPNQSIDIIFSDYESHPSAIAALLSFYLPKMSQASSIFIDGASTYLPSYLFIEKIIADLNQGKIPSVLLATSGDEFIDQWIKLVHTRRFTLIHLTEKKSRDQNSTAWLKIEPVDHIPHPVTKMR